MKKITALIISHNHEDYLNSLLLDLNKYEKNIIKIIILHNVLPKKKIFIPKKISKRIFNIYNKKPLGLSKNINKSIKFCKSEFIALINPDIKLYKNVFIDLLENFRHDKSLALVSPLIVDKNGKIQDTKRDYPSLINLIKREIFRIKYKNSGKDWLAGMFMVFKTRILKRLKFDENFFLYCEDVDIGLRLKKLSYRFLLNKKISVEHIAQKTSRKNINFLFYHIKSYLYLWKKHGFFK